jgi:NAD(P)-dependent dehydrogenase (short-subunit alcohol dehydrogenase family)
MPEEQTSIFNRPYKALVLGATGTIGSAFVDAFQADLNCTHVEAVARSLSEFDLTKAESIERQAEICRSNGPFQILVDATGALTIDGLGPEKSLASLESENLLTNFHINAIGPILALRHFSKLLAPGPSLYAKLSARVGSISDNRKGGWYGYRAAKAALNMLMHTAAIELQRKNPELQVVLLQPGTVRSALSKPFLASVAHVLEPLESVTSMIQTLKALSPQAGAQFLDYKGEKISW